MTPIPRAAMIHFEAIATQMEAAYSASPPVFGRKQGAFYLPDAYRIPKEPAAHDKIPTAYPD